MRWLAPLAALLALAGPAVAGTTPTTVSFTDGVCTKNIYLRPHGYPASAVDLQPCQVIHVWGGTIGKIKG
ncbi:MAG TPA: hypothetical protein VLC74_00850, partial [Rhizomicrobium sp.]|nr:hypothetical protein [Rhizomicrobium sp.]